MAKEEVQRECERKYINLCYVAILPMCIKCSYEKFV